MSTVAEFNLDCIPGELLRAAEELAEERGVTLDDVIAGALLRYILGEKE